VNNNAGDGRAGVTTSARSMNLRWVGAAGYALSSTIDRMDGAAILLVGHAALR
jgi:hypothetical protein